MASRTSHGRVSGATEYTRASVTLEPIVDRHEAWAVMSNTSTPALGRRLVEM